MKPYHCNLTSPTPMGNGPLAVIESDGACLCGPTVLLRVHGDDLEREQAVAHGIVSIVNGRSQIREALEAGLAVVDEVGRRGRDRAASAKIRAALAVVDA